MKISRLLLVLLIVVVIACSAVLLAMPSLLSTTTGRSFLVDSVNKKIPGTVRIDSLSLSWFGGQQMRGVTIRDPSGHPVVSLDRFTTEATLLSLARGQLSFGRTEIAGLRADIVVDPNGAINLEEALSSGAAEKQARPAAPGITIPVPLSGEIVLVDSSIALKAEGIAPVALQDIKGKARITAVDAPIQVELSARTRQAGSSGDISLEALLAGFDSRGTLVPERMDGRIMVRIANLPVDSVDRLVSQAGVLRQAVGGHLDLTAEMKLTRGDGTAVITVTSPLVSADVAATVADGRFSLARPAAINARLTSGLVKTLGKEQGLALAADVPVTVTVEQLTAPVTGFRPNAVGLKVKLAVGDGMIRAKGPMNGLGWHKVALAVDAENLAEELKLRCNGIAEQANNQGVFHVDIGLAHLIDDQGLLTPAKISADAKVELESLPMALFDSLLDQDGLLTTLAGPTLTVKMKAQAADLATPKGAVSVNARAARLSLNADLALAEAVSLTKPAVVDLELTPAAFASLQAAGDQKKSGPDRQKRVAYRLEKTTGITATVLNLRLPLPDKKQDNKIKLGELALEMDLLARDLFLADGDRAAGYTSLHAGVTTAGLARGVDFTVSGQARGATDKQKGSLAAEGRLGNLLDSGGAFSTAAMTATISTETNTLPMALLDILAGSRGKLAGILGETVTMKGNIDLDLGRKFGPINFSEQSPYSKAELAALLGNGLLQLEKPVAADLEITPALAKIVLAKVNPLLARAVSADRPITLRVDKEKFQIPVSPFDAAKSQVGQARAEFGNVTLENGGILKALLALLKTEAGDRLTAQITPITARMENGVATYERTDFILDNRIRVASWGRVDLARDRVEMVLGLPAETLGKIFGVYDLAADYVMQIPVEGTTGDPKVNWAKAGQQIALLLARKKLGGQFPGGELLQGILGGGAAPAAPPAPTAPKEQEQTQQTAPAPQQQNPVQQLLRQFIK